MVSDSAGMVRRDSVGDGNVGAGENGVGQVEILTQAVESATEEGQIGRVEADVDDAVKAASRAPGELSKGTQQIMEVVGMGVVRGESIGQPGLRIVDGDLNHIGNQFGL
jgi:hypothetical protein